MELVVDRKWKKEKYTISNLTIDGKWFCNVLEDKDRGLSSNMPVSTIKMLKKASITAIPSGTYEITLDVVSPKYSKKQQYKAIDGKLPRLLDVPGFEGILIHIGNTAEDSAGCILVGHNKVKGQVVNSTATFNELYSLLLDGKKRGEKLIIKIV